MRLVRDADSFLGGVAGSDDVGVAAAGADVWVDPGGEFAFDVRGGVAGVGDVDEEELGVEGRGEGAGFFEGDACDLGEVDRAEDFSDRRGGVPRDAEHGAVGVVDDFLGDGAEEGAAPAGAAVRAHDDQVGVDGLRRFENRLRRRLVDDAGLDGVAGVGQVALDPLGQVAGDAVAKLDGGLQRVRGRSFHHVERDPRLVRVEDRDPAAEAALEKRCPANRARGEVAQIGRDEDALEAGDAHASTIGRAAGPVRIDHHMRVCRIAMRDARARPMLAAMIGRHLTRDWIAANAIGEVLGLGLAALIAIAVAQAHTLPPAEEILVVTAAFLAIGAYEGAIVGVAQWLVLRRLLPSLRAKSWIAATVTGAVVAWMLGRIPSALADWESVSGGVGQPAPSLSMIAGLSAAAGAALGGDPWRRAMVRAARARPSRADVDRGERARLGGSDAAHPPRGAMWTTAAVVTLST